MSEDNGLRLLNDEDSIDADGYLTIGFATTLDARFDKATPEDVRGELLRQLDNGDFLEWSAISYRITGP